MQSQRNANRRIFLKSALLASAPLLAGQATHAAPVGMPEEHTSGKDDRTKWLAIVERVSQPVLEAISRQKLHATMPVECAKGQEEASRNSTQLQAVGRLLSGLAPWLEAKPGDDHAEEKLRNRYREWARLAIHYGTDSGSPDALNFGSIGNRSSTRPSWLSPSSVHPASFGSSWTPRPKKTSPAPSLKPARFSPVSTTGCSSQP